MTTNAEVNVGRFFLAMFRAMKASTADARYAGLQEWQRDMIRPDIDDVMNGVARDNAGGSVHQYRSMLPQAEAPTKPPVGKGGWVEAAPLRNGYDPLIDAQIDAQDARDRRELERKLGGR